MKRAKKGCWSERKLIYGWIEAATASCTKLWGHTKQQILRKFVTRDGGEEAPAASLGAVEIAYQHNYS